MKGAISVSWSIALNEGLCQAVRRKIPKQRRGSCSECSGLAMMLILGKTDLVGVFFVSFGQRMWSALLIVALFCVEV